MTSDNPLDFTGRVAIVTGGTKNLGRAIATSFLEAGADVVVCARNAPDEPVSAAGRDALFVPCDVRDAEQVQAVVAAANDAYGRIDVLVNNAGGAPPVASAEASQRFNERVLALNLLAPMTFSAAVHQTMAAQDTGGVILNIGSVSGVRANPFGVAYGAAKAGLVNMSDTLACEWGPKIRVLTVTVGLIVTDDTRAYYGDEEGIARVGSTLKMGRMGEVHEIADVCLFLASPLASWMTGVNVRVDGGDEKPAYLTASTGEVSEKSG